MPTRRPAPTITAIAAGSWHTCAVVDGGVKCWGMDAGQLGDGTRISTSVPSDVLGLTEGIGAVSAGEPFSCALTTAGGVKCWGSNDDGELGHGSTMDRGGPVVVSGLAGDATAVSAGLANTCAVTEAGGVRCWGSNYGARDRDGLAVGSSVPVDVAGPATGAIAVAVGEEHACALTSRGVACWGSNDAGLLGNDSTTESIVPVEVDFPVQELAVDAYGAIEHAPGPTDVLFRYDHDPDRDDLVASDGNGGGFFQPGPELTLYGDGTIIFRDETAPASPAKAGIVRASPFAVGQGWVAHRQLRERLAAPL
jgi:hypothetical protein